ncbi:MAG: hypothetical protein SGBAC_011797 [Bacillariaceae sp.]
MMVFFPNQYGAVSTPDTLQSIRNPQMASVDSNSPINSGLQFLQPNQCSANLLAFVKENNATLNFPQKLMLLLSYVDNERERGEHITCIAWARDGHVFVIKDRKELVDSLLPLFFREGKFSSFTRKLYRWGFRQICIPKGGNKTDRELLFGHEYFQRDNKPLLSEMRSVTAAGTRRAIAALTNKKKARKNKDKDASKKAAPALVPPPVVSVSKLENKTIESVSDLKPQSLVQVRLERLLGCSNTATKRATTKPQPSFQTATIGQNSTQNTLDALLKAGTSPTNELKPQDLVQAHLERLLNGSAMKQANTKLQQTPFQTRSLRQNSEQTQTPFQTRAVEQNSTSSGFDALLKAKSHSLMPAPVQSKFLGLNDTTALQNHVNYLKAISQCSMVASAPAANSFVQAPSMSINIGARLQTLRQMGASKQEQQQVGAQQRTTIPNARLAPSHYSLSQACALPPATFGLPKGYLDLIQQSRGGLAGQSTSAPNHRVSMPNIILSESSAPAARNFIEPDTTSVSAAIQQRLSSEGMFAKQRWR